MQLRHARAQSVLPEVLLGAASLVSLGIVAACVAAMAHKDPPAQDADHSQRNEGDWGMNSGPCPQLVAGTPGFCGADGAFTFPASSVATLPTLQSLRPSSHVELLSSAAQTPRTPVMPMRRHSSPSYPVCARGLPLALCRSLSLPPGSTLQLAVPGVMSSAAPPTGAQTEDTVTSMEGQALFVLRVARGLSAGVVEDSLSFLSTDRREMLRCVSSSARPDEVIVLAPERRLTLKLAQDGGAVAGDARFVLYAGSMPGARAWAVRVAGSVKQQRFQCFDAEGEVGASVEPGDFLFGGVGRRYHRITCSSQVDVSVVVLALWMIGRLAAA